MREARWHLVAFILIGMVASTLAGAGVAALISNGGETGDVLNFVGGMVGAAIGSALAVLGAQHVQRNERRSAWEAACREVVRAVKDGLLIVEAANANFPTQTYNSAVVREIKARAEVCEAILERLTLRPELSDGAIAIGSGIRILMGIVRDAAAVFTGGGVGHGSRAAACLAAGAPVEAEVRDRLAGVEDYLAEMTGGR